MGLIKQTYPPGTERAIASYDSVDIAEGTGSVRFFAFSHQEDVTRSFAISRTALTSEANEGFTNGTISSAHPTYAPFITLACDLAKFNLPQRIKGTARYVATFGCETAGANTAANMFLIVTLQKVGAAGTTDIASGQSRDLTLPTGTKVYTTVNVQIDVDTLAHFKKGETLRVRIVAWGKKSTNTRVARVYHNPLDESRPETVNTSVFEVHVPFVLDL